MEEGEEIGLVLARASDIRSRVSACAAAARSPSRRDADEAVKRLGAAKDEEGEEEEEEVESLVGISDALESLERQLAALQDLQHQQRYERETILSHIDRSRRSLLNKLKEYKGHECEVIHEAAAFAGEKIEHDDGLILPPYSNHVTNSFALDLYPLNFLSKSKDLQNGLDSNGQDDTRTNGLENRNTRTSNHSSWGGIGSFIGLLAKTAVMVVGAVSIMKATGYEPVIGRKSIKLDIGRFFSKEAANSGHGHEQSSTLCPPGKVMVLEDGRAHCVVKERVEIPFDTNIVSPSASYGLG